MRVVAQPGDTLWSIASRHHGDISITRYVDTLVDLNGGPTIQAGQEVVLPVARDRADRAPRRRRRRLAGMGQYPVAVHCPSCQADDTKVVDSRLAEEGAAVRRRRQCLTCSIASRPSSVSRRCRWSSSSPTVRRSPSIARRSPSACAPRARADRSRRSRSSSSQSPSRTSCGCRAARSARAVSGSPCSTACACSTRWPTCASPRSTRTSTPPPTSRASSSCSASSARNRPV